jgi:TonB family protein
MNSAGETEVYSARELAEAAGVPFAQVQALMATGELPSVRARFVRQVDAVTWGRRLRGSAPRPRDLDPSLPGALTVSWPEPIPRQPMFAPAPATPRPAGLPAAISAVAHLIVGAAAVLITTAGLDSAAPARTENRLTEPLRMVYLALPGPGGGGGGGGLRQPKPAPVAKREGTRPLSSPLPPREPPAPLEPPPDDPPPPPIDAEALPPVIAPVITSASDEEDRAGVLDPSDATEVARGPGDGGGAGTGAGTGLGEGEGSGIGAGEGGGTGGGPYRPGSGIAPPSLLREVKPVYTEEARRRNVTGDVLLEIVVRSDGSVGDVRVLDGLGYGLDQRAADAVRQWRFAPATRRGMPVDVLVEVAVEFRLR